MIEAVVWLIISGGALVLFLLELFWWWKRARTLRQAGLDRDWGATWLSFSVLMITLNLSLFVVVGIIAIAFPANPPPVRDIDDLVAVFLLIGGEFFVVLAGLCLLIYRKWFS